MIDTSDRTTAIVVVLLSFVFCYFVQIAKQSDYARDVISRISTICEAAAQPRELDRILSACEEIIKNDGGEE